MTRPVPCDMACRPLLLVGGLPLLMLPTRTKNFMIKVDADGIGRI